MTKKQRASLIMNRLEAEYPNAVCSLIYNKEKPYELLISTRMSAQCTDARVNIVTKELFSKYQTIEEIANADVADIEKIIYSCGFYKMKAKDTVKMCQQLMERYGGSLPDTMEELTALSGIGRKTANLILGDIFKKPAIVVDTHCMRICARLSLCEDSRDPNRIEKELRAVLDPERSSDFCHRLVLFGRDTCSSQKPKCDGCVMNDICKASTLKQKGKL